MTNSPPPRKPILDFDEWVAVIVSFGAIALILFLGLSPSEEILDPDKIPELGLPGTETEVQPEPESP